MEKRTRAEAVRRDSTGGRVRLGMVLLFLMLCWMVTLAATVIGVVKIFSLNFLEPKEKIDVAVPIVVLFIIMTNKEN